MALFDFLKSKRSSSATLSNSAGSANVTVDRLAIAQLRELSQAFGGFNANFPTKQSEQIAMVYSCVSLLADNISKCPLEVVQVTNNKVTPLTNHILFNQLKYEPSSIYSAQDWLKMLVVLRELRGNVFFQINSGSFDLIDPDKLDSADVKGGAIFYSSSRDKEVSFRQDEVLHFKGISKDGFYGLSKISSLKNELQTYYKSTKTLDSIYSNGMNSRVYLEPVSDRSTTTEKQDEKIADMQNKYAGYSNQSSLLVVPNLFTLKTFTIPREDQAILASASFSDETIASVFGCPIYLLKFNPTVAIKLSEIKDYFIKTTLDSYMTSIENELSDKLLDFDDRNKGISIRFDRSKLYDNDIAFLTPSMVQLVNAGIINRNEARTELGFEPDTNPNMDKNTVQVQNISIQDTDFANHPLTASKVPVDNKLKSDPTMNETKDN